MRIQPFQSLYPNINLIVAPDLFFSAIGREFSKYYQAGMFNEFREKAFFIYQISTGDKLFSGIVTDTDIRDLIDGKILFHENTIADKEQDMVQSSLERRAMVKPVMLFHKKIEKLEAWIKKTTGEVMPDFSCTLENGEIHQFWKISDQPSISWLERIFEKEIDHAYVADGHHRCSSTLRLYQNKSDSFKDFHFEAMLTAYFSLNQLEVHDHVKVVSILDTLKPEVFIARLSKFAEIRHLKKFKYPAHKHEFVIVLNNEVYRANWKKSVLRKFEKKNQLLDAFIMNELVFQQIFQIDDVRRDSRITYFPGNETEEMIMERGRQQSKSIILIQYPLQIRDIMKVADSKINLPPKSTWFEPKIKSGILAQKY